MLNNLKKTFKHILIYSLGNLGLRLVGVILLPLYTSYLTTSDYGALIILETTGTLMFAIFSFKLSTAMMRWCSQEKDESRRKSYVFTNYFFSVSLLLLLNAIFFPLYGSLSELFFGTAKYDFYFPILFISITFEILNLYPLELIRLNERPVFFVVISILRLIVVLTANIILLVVLEYGIEGILIGTLIGHSMVFIITLPFVLKNMRFKFDLVQFREMLLYGMPLVFVSIAMMVFSFGDRYIIKYLLDFSQVAIYSLGYKISSVTNMLIIQSFQTGFLPIAYKMYKKPEAKRFFTKTLTYYTFIIVGFSLFISVFAKEIVEVFTMDKSYYPAYKIIPFMAFALILKGVQYMFSLAMHFVKQTKYNAFIVTSASLFNIGMNFIFIPLFGIYGAAITTIFSWLIMIVAFYKISQKHYPVKYEIKKIVLLLATFITLFLLSIPLNEVDLMIRIPFKALIILIMPLILFPLGFYEKKEIEKLKEFWKRFKTQGLRGFFPNI